MADFGSLSQRTIKVSHNGEIYRGKLSVLAGATSFQAFSAIRSTASALVGIPGDRLRLKYEDEEGDLCTLTETSMADLVALSPAGVLRLSLQVVEEPSPEQSDVTAVDTSQPTCVEENVEAPSESGVNPADESKGDETLRSQIRNLLQKIPVGVSGLVLGVVQHMDPSQLHAYVRMIKEYKEANAEQYRTHFNIAGDDAQQCRDAVEEMLPRIVDMDQDALKALIVEELRSICAAANVGNTSGVQQQADPLSAIFGAFLGGNSPAQPNPVGQLINAMLAGKGAGKGSAPPQFGGTPQGMPGMNPWENMFQNCFPPNTGGNCHAGQIPTQFGSPPNSSGNCPWEGALGALFAAKGMGKGKFSRGSPGYNMPEGSQNNEVDAPSSNAEPQQQDTSQTSNEARAVFDDSVEDLVNMGLVSDRQVARELLTKHGDISTVVSILTDGA